MQLKMFHIVENAVMNLLEMMNKIKKNVINVVMNVIINVIENGLNVEKKKMKNVFVVVK